MVTSIFHHAHPNIFDGLLIFVNLYQLAKNQLIPPDQIGQDQIICF